MKQIPSAASAEPAIINKSDHVSQLKSEFDDLETHAQRKTKPRDNMP